MTPKLYKAADVCEIAQLQPYVLRSWEKEFPGIGMQQSPDGPRMYRETDLEQVQRIKQLVFVEGLTLSGARRRLDGGNGTAAAAPAPQAKKPVEPSRVEPARAAASKPTPKAAVPDAEMRATLATVRAGLQSILDLLSGVQATPAEEYQLAAPAAAPAPVRVRKLTARRAPEKKTAPVAKRKRAGA